MDCNDLPHETPIFSLFQRTVVLDLSTIIVSLTIGKDREESTYKRVKLYAWASVLHFKEKGPVEHHGVSSNVSHVTVLTWRTDRSHL